MGLTACNNNDKNEVNDQTTDQVGMNTNKRNDSGLFNVGNNRDDGIDHNGPLTEDYTNTNNSEPDVDYNMFNNNNNRKNNNNDNGTLTNNYSKVNNRGVDNDINLFRNKRKKNNNDNEMISAYQTSLNSNKYPHTKAVLIQDAKYQYIRIDPRQGNGPQFGMIQQSQPNLQPESPNTKAPVQQAVPQQTQPVPNPQQTQPVPKSQQTQPGPTKQTQPVPQQPAQTQNNAPTTGALSQYAQQVIDLTNAQRSKNGLPALKADTQLNGVAQKKSLDMQQKNYFSHTSPTYGSPFDMMRDFGVTYKSAGENIAQGQRTPQEVVTGWMNSEGHRQNILSAKFTHIGVGFEETGKHWTQMFIGK
jgi:uncharacterized YkwD family protein